MKPERTLTVPGSVTRLRYSIFVGGALLIGLSQPISSSALPEAAQPPGERAGASGTSLTQPGLRYTVPEKGYAILRRGNVEAVIVDNRA